MAGLNFSENQQKLLAAVVEHVQVADWDAIAAATEYKDGTAARKAWWSMKNKITATGKEDGEAGKKATPKKRKSAAEETPSKKQKGNKSTAIPAATATEDDDPDADFEYDDEV